MTKITPFLWFDKNMKEIVSFYLSVFKDAKLISSGELSDTPSGNVETATIEIGDQKLRLLTAGPMFKFTEAVSFVVNCKDQAEVDYYWERLSAHPDSEQCGWLKDKYGLSWQIIPDAFETMMSEGDEEQVARLTQAFLQMKKFDIAKLEQAFLG